MPRLTHGPTGLHGSGRSHHARRRADSLSMSHKPLISGCHSKVMGISDAVAGKLVATAPIGTGVDVTGSTPRRNTRLRQLAMARLLSYTKTPQTSSQWWTTSPPCLAPARWLWIRRRIVSTRCRPGSAPLLQRLPDSAAARQYFRGRSRSSCSSAEQAVSNQQRAIAMRWPSLLHRIGAPALPGRACSHALLSRRCHAIIAEARPSHRSLFAIH